MNPLKYVFQLILILSFNLSYSQENCSNGIDDDLDGLIDLNDPECDCNGITSITPNNSIPNPSFEQFKHCPHLQNDGTHNGYIESELFNWQRGNSATSDYYNCGWQSSVELTPPSVPYPDGTGYVGIGDGHDIWIGNIWKEYIGTVLNSPLSSGINYNFTYNITAASGTGLSTFQWAPHYIGTSNANMELVIYGYQSNSPLNSFPQVPGSLCPTAIDPNWVILGSQTITTNTNSWVQGNIHFTAPTNIKAISKVL